MPGSSAIGFEVTSYFPAGFRWALADEDLAGNPFEADFPYLVA